MTYYIYILYSNSIDRYYVGYSQNPWIRFEQHLSNTSDKYTGKAKDWDLKTIYSAENKSEVIRIERFIKKQKSRILIERMYQEDFIGIDNLAKLVRVPHVRGLVRVQEEVRKSSRNVGLFCLHEYCRPFY